MYNCYFLSLVGKRSPLQAISVICPALLTRTVRRVPLLNVLVAPLTLEVFQKILRTSLAVVLAPRAARPVAAVEAAAGVAAQSPKRSPVSTPK